MSDNQRMFAEAAGMLHRLEASNAKGPQAMRNDYRDQPPDHLSVGGVVNVLANDMRQLFEEIGELRARLAPVLVEPKLAPGVIHEGAPVHCKLAAELGDVLGTLRNARELVSATLSQLDL